MHKRRYDPKTIAIFDTIGTYFVDVFYNNHYFMAKDLVESGKSASITQAYQTAVISYMNGIKKHEHLCAKVVKGLHGFYIKSNHGVLSSLFADFEDRVLSQFIPPEYYMYFPGTRKDQTFQQIIIKAVNEFGAMMVESKYLSMVIDNRGKENLPILQDRIIDIFIMQREEYYAKFADQISKRNGNSDLVDKAIVDKLKRALVDEKKRCCKIDNDKNTAINIISQLLAKYNVLVTENEKLATENAALRVRIEHLRTSQARVSNKTAMVPVGLSTKHPTNAAIDDTMDLANIISQFTHSEPSDDEHLSTHSDDDQSDEDEATADSDYSLGDSAEESANAAQPAQGSDNMPEPSALPFAALDDDPWAQM